MATAKANKVTAPAQPLKLYRLYEVAQNVGYSYATLQQWFKDDEIATPAPQFVVGDTEHWTEDSFPVWKELVDKEIQRVATSGHTIEEMGNRVLAMAKRANQRATYARSRDRSGYSKSAVQELINEAESVEKFVAALSDTSRIEPQELRAEIRQNLREAQTKLNNR